MTRVRARLGARLAAGIVASALVAACGTTVQTTAGAPPAGDGLSLVPPPAVAGDPLPSPGSALPTGPSSTGVDVGAGRQTGDGPTGAPPAARTAPGGRGAQPRGPVRGVTAKTVRIGVAYQANLDAANSALGGDRITSGDQVAETNLLVRDINARGGVGGRTLLVDFFAYDAQSSQPYSAQDQAACAHFTEDVEVFAVVGAGRTDTFQQCMEKAGTAVVGADIVRFDAADFRRYPHYFDVQELDLERLTRALSAELAENGWAGGWDAALGRAGNARPKVGIIAFDQPRFVNAVRRGLLPQLRQRGLDAPDDDVVFVQEPTSQSDISQAAAQVQNAVLRFRQDGVTHVVLLDTHGGITQVFLNAAEAQRYYPRYGMGSGSGTQALLDGGIIRPGQLAGARGLGWIPMLDLPPAGNPDDGRWSSADRRRCLALMRQGGQSFTSTNAASIALLYCDQLWLLDRALDAVGGTPSLAGLTTAIERLGPAAPTASLGASSYGPGKHVAVARGVEWAFDTGCSCMTYGRVRAIS